VRPLAPSPAWTLVTPYCKRTRPRRGTNTKAAGFPPLSRPSPAAFSPLRARPRADPSGLGHAATFHSSAQGPPPSRNADRWLETAKKTKTIKAHVARDDTHQRVFSCPGAGKSMCDAPDESNYNKRLRINKILRHRREEEKRFVNLSRSYWRFHSH
jgi:hypothetical protein